MVEKIRAYILKEYIAEEEANEFTNETPLVSSGLIDSINILQVVDFLEETFKIEFEPHEVDQENLNTVNLMLAYLESKM